MRAEQAHQPGDREGLDDEHVRGCRIGVERHGLRPGLDLSERAHQAERRAGDRRAAGVGVVFARARNRGLDQHRGHRRQNHHRDQRHRIRALAIVVAAASEEHRESGEHHNRAGERRRDRADQDVAVLDVRQFVPEHAGQLLVREDLEDPFGCRDSGMLRIASGRKCVRRRLRDDVAARHRQPGAPGELAHDPIQAVIRADFLGAVASEDDLVREEVRTEVGDHGDHEAEHHPLRTAQSIADHEKKPGHDAEQHGRFECVHIFSDPEGRPASSLYVQHQRGDERGAVRQRVDEHVLLQGVRAVADRAEAVQRWHAEGGGEIAVGSAAGAPLGQVTPSSSAIALA